MPLGFLKVMNIGNHHYRQSDREEIKIHRFRVSGYGLVQHECRSQLPAGRKETARRELNEVLKSASALL